MTTAPQLLEWILNNNNPYFHINLHLRTRLDSIELECVYGLDQKIETTVKHAFDFTDVKGGDFTKELERLKEIKADCDAKYAPENIKETKRKEKLKKIEQMKKELEELEKEV